MAVDRFTKCLLTVIAGCLLWIGVMMSGLPVSAAQIRPRASQMVAQGPAQPVVIVGWGTMNDEGHVDLQLAKAPAGGVRTDAELPVTIQQNPASPVPVKLDATGSALTLAYTAQQPLPVGITGIKPVADWEPIRTKVEPQPYQRLPDGNER
jgi:hypothetical protein